MYIQKATPKDATKISYLIYKNTERVTENHYTKAQIDIWKRRNTPTAIKKSFAFREIFCLFENDRLLGTIALQQNEVVGLYVAYSQRRKGLGKILLDYLENYAKKNKINELTLTSTPSAKNFYLKNGYFALEYVVLDIDGEPFRELRMIKHF